MELIQKMWVFRIREDEDLDRFTRDSVDLTLSLRRILALRDGARDVVENARVLAQPAVGDLKDVPERFEPLKEFCKSGWAQAGYGKQCQPILENLSHSGKDLCATGMPYEFTELRDERGDALSGDRRDGKLRFKFLEHASPSLGRQEIDLGRCDEHRLF